ncbi:MAG: flavodoxin family protein [Peptococcaceae bacterium]|nr:flavodoxin family protein [Peptococcaceae bacterium]
MKISAICGSPRREKSRTAQLTRELIAAAEGAEFIDVTRLDIGPCLACDRCHHLGYCVQKDDFNQVFEKMLEADGIVLASPVYIYQVSAQLKMFLDRFANPLHCLRLLGKYGAAVATAGGSGHEETVDYLEQFLQRLGVQCVGKLALTMEDGPVDQESAKAARELGEKLVAAIKEQKEFPGQLQTIETRRAYFRDLMIKRRDRWPWEYRYWREKGWL